MPSTSQEGAEKLSFSGLNTSTSEALELELGSLGSEARRRPRGKKKACNKKALKEKIFFVSICQSKQFM
ncbi:hypothetical protein MDAP_001606 [Mitosporidium daphniae]|uniref:Uncharacterized protein n=1 Tax=Mitosporidium daphniae TaxID=1485682 RepID=A0A098VR12_9MICR|nr:uncharacterized protein DI09_348p10 [Mitosporidium daphniae]KGG51478.1 hypothetical protein DI09_348p10 [Mitosporidium daphniae]|eukprot:XP_013237914.1 uncharacterized protein DI09_348p10 [Mitosporidium daphniae]